MKKYLSRSVILSALLFAGFICTQPALAQVKFPYNVYGNILNADGSVPAPADIRFTAYISSRPAEVLTEASQGSSVTDEGGSTQYLLDLASLPTQYQNGDQVVISVVNSLLSQAKTNIVTVDTAVPFKQSDVQLVPRPVIVPPSITSHPDDVVTRVSGRATFNVGVSGTAPFTFQWKKGSTTLPGQTSQTLVLTNVQTTDAGAYSVSITNAAGFTNSNPATLTVLVPPTIVTPPRSQVVTQGLTSVSFDVVAAGTPPFSYQWRNASWKRWRKSRSFRICNLPAATGHGRASSAGRATPAGSRKRGSSGS